MIRPFRPSDVDALTEIYNYYVRTSTATFESEEKTVDQMRERLTGPADRYPCFVAEDEGRVVGYGALHPWRPRFDCVAEATMYFSPDATGRGLGKQMLRLLIDEGRKLPWLNGIIACINATNTPSRALVESFGFHMAGSYERVGRKFGQWLDDVDYQLLF